MTIERVVLCRLDARTSLSGGSNTDRRRRNGCSLTPRSILAWINDPLYPLTIRTHVQITSTNSFESSMICRTKEFYKCVKLRAKEPTFK